MARWSGKASPAQVSRARDSHPSPPGSWFRGRRLRYDADEQAIEQARQDLVDERMAAANGQLAERMASVSELELARAAGPIDPELAYREHRAAYVRTGELAQLALMLEYVR